tara:strand:- start:92 stop:781 length:690 start_codon:yes stop_codon:yes gene_type:complete
MTTTSYDMYMEFIKGKKMNTTPYTDDVKALMTIIEQGFIDYDDKTNELQDDNDKLEEARLKQSLKTIALKKIVEEKDKIFKESQSDLLFSNNLWISSCKEVKEKDKTIEIMKKKLSEGYNADSSEEEEDEELSYEDDPNWDECEECIVDEGEMILTMSEGHSAWGYVITKSGVFLHTQSGHYPINGKLVWTGIGKGSYVCDKINTYSLKEGEMDVYNFFITDHKAIMDL